MPEGSDSGKGKRRDRSFADAMREAGGKAPAWTGSVINPLQGGPSPGERERIKAGVRERDQQATAGRPWYMTPGSSQFVPAGCFTMAAILAGIALFKGALEIAIWLEFTVHDPGMSFPVISDVFLARVLLLLLMAGLAVPFYFLARRYQKDYRRRMEELVRTTADEELLEPTEADLNAAYDHLPRLVKGILLRRPRIRKEWAEFLHRDIDVYLASRGRYRIPPLEWAGRFWVFIWIIAKFVLFIPEGLFNYGLFGLLRVHAGLDSEAFLYPDSTATVLAVLFAGHALALQEIRRDVVNRAIYKRAPRDPAAPVQPPPPPPGPPNRLADRFRRQDLGMEYQYVLAALATGLLFSWLVVIVFAGSTLFLSGTEGTFSIALYLILACFLLYIAVQTMLRSRLRVRVAERLAASGLLIDLAEEGGRLGQIYDFTPWPFTWFLGPRPRDHRGWLRLLANNIDWYLRPPRTLFRAQWLASLAIPVTAGLIVASAAGIAGPGRYNWLMFLIALLLFLLMIPLQQVILRHSMMIILIEAIRRSLAGDSPEEAPAPADGGECLDNRR